MAIGEVSTNTADTVEVTHQFVNKTDKDVTLNWVDEQGSEHCYQTLGPGHSSSQGTFSTHVWRMRWPNKQVLGSYVGAGAVVEILGPGRIRTEPLDLTALMKADPAWGQWRKRSEALGIPIFAYDCVGEAAVVAGSVIIHHMLSYCPREILARLVKVGACVGVIGRTQLTSDMPGHQHLKLSKGGRDLDATTRGLGGNEGCPMCTCGEENLDMVNDDRYPHENILIHEFAHTVMTLGMSKEQQERVKCCYQWAMQHNLYAKGCYALENEDEYYAEGTQSWFDATVRTDVNGGINTREKLISYDPGLATIMAEVWGPNPWRYTHDSPKPFAGTEPSKSHTYAKPSPYGDPIAYGQSNSMQRPNPNVYPNAGYAYPPAPSVPNGQYQYGSYGQPPVYTQPVAYAQAGPYVNPNANGDANPYAYRPTAAAPAYPQVEPASSSMCGSWNPFAACFPSAQPAKRPPAYDPPYVHYNNPPGGYANSKMQ